jgi:transcriptional regulator with XRE-family HTH domain
MSITLSYSKSTFGNVYEQAMQTQFQIIGYNLSQLRKSRDETIELVANAVNLQPGVLENIEKGEHDFKLHVLFNLCNYYETNLEDVVRHRGLMQLKIA